MFDIRRAGALIAATTTTAVVMAGVPFAGAAEADQVQIRVANITDFHGRLAYNPTMTTVKDADGNPVKDENGKDVKKATPKKGDEMGAAYIAGIINYLRGQNENLIVTNSGDNQGGSAFVSAITDDEYTMDFVNAIGTQGTAIGNHEFDKGYKDLTDRIIPRTTAEDPNFVSADNDRYKGQTQLGANIFLKGTETRETNPYNIVEVEGVKVALIGTTSIKTVEKSNPENVAAVDIKDSAEWVNIEAKKLKESGEADVVIALIHDDAEERAPKLDKDFVDFLFGGDSHVVYNNVEANVPAAQSWEYGKMVTDLDFKFDKATGEIVDPVFNQYDASHLAELKIEEDAAVKEIVAKAQAASEKEGEKVVATIDADFKRGSNPGDKRQVATAALSPPRTT